MPEQENTYESPLLSEWASKAAGSPHQTAFDMRQQRLARQGLPPDFGDQTTDVPTIMIPGAVKDLATLGPIRRFMDAVDVDTQHMEPGYQPTAAGPGFETAAMLAGGAGLIPGEANAMRAGARIPASYYAKVPQERMLSRTGISHPGYRWEVYDPKTGNVMSKELTTRVGATKAQDRLDNKYGGYRYRVRPVEAKAMTEEETEFLKKNNIDLNNQSPPTGGGDVELGSGMRRLPARNNPITGRKQVAPEQKLTDLFIEGGPPVDVTPRAALRGQGGRFSTINNYYRNRTPSPEEMTPLQTNPMYDPANPPPPTISRLETPRVQDPASVDRNLAKMPNSFTLGSGPADSRMSPAMEAAAQSVRDTKPNNFWGDALKSLRGFQQDKAPILDKYRQDIGKFDYPGQDPGSLEGLMNKMVGKSGPPQSGELGDMMNRTMARTKEPVSSVEKNASKMPNSFLPAAAAAPAGMSAGDQGQGSPMISPGVAKFLMSFLKANPDLAKEMSTRMQAVINGKQIQGQQGKPAQMAMGTSPPGIRPANASPNPDYNPYPGWAGRQSVPNNYKMMPLQQEDAPPQPIGVGSRQG